MEGLDAKYDGANLPADLVKQSWGNSDDVSKVRCLLIVFELASTNSNCLCSREKTRTINSKRTCPARIVEH